MEKKHIRKPLILALVSLSILSCGLITGSSILNTPTVTPRTGGWTLNSNDIAGSEGYIAYGVNIFYKIYVGDLTTCQNTYNSDFLNTWTPSFNNPDNAVSTAKYFPLNNGSTATYSPPIIALPIPSSLVTPLYWSLNGDCSFNVAVDGSILISDGTTTRNYYRNVIRSINDAIPPGVTSKYKSFTFSSEFSASDADLPSLNANYYLGLIAVVYANPGVLSSQSKQYSQPVQLNNGALYPVGNKN